MKAKKHEEIQLKHLVDGSQLLLEEDGHSYPLTIIHQLLPPPTAEGSDQLAKVRPVLDYITGK